MYIENKKDWDEAFQERIAIRNMFKIRDMTELSLKIILDKELNERKEINNCKICHYETRIALQAFTDTNCSNSKCRAEMTFSNSDINTLCLTCARNTDSCTHCGGKMD